MCQRLATAFKKEHRSALVVLFEFLRGTPRIAFKYLDEISGVIIAAVRGYLIHPHVGVDQKLPGQVHAHGGHIFVDADAFLLAEHPGKIARAVPGNPGQISNANVLTNVLINRCV